MLTIVGGAQVQFAGGLANARLGTTIRGVKYTGARKEGFAVATSRQSRKILVNRAGEEALGSPEMLKDFEKMMEITLTPEVVWRIWIRDIVNDPQMDKARVIKHIRAHVLKHMPEMRDSKKRWEAWLAGAYNLLAILGSMKGTDPPHELGIDLLHRKWIESPSDHTPPPEVKAKKPKRRRKPLEKSDTCKGS